MKHAAVKVKNTEKISSKAKDSSIKIEKNVLLQKALKSVRNGEDASKKKAIISSTSNKKSKAKPAESVVVAFPKSKLKANKSAPIISEKKVERPKDVPVISPKQTKSKKSALKVSAKPETSAVKLKKNQKTTKLPSISTPKKNVSTPDKKLLPQENFPANRASVAASEVKIKNTNLKADSTGFVAKPKTKKEKIVKSLSVEKTETARRTLFTAINKISVIKKQLNLTGQNAGKSSPEANLSLPLNTPKTVSPEPEIAVKSTVRKLKPKDKKPIGAAIFRGKKERYDFQVYAIDAEIEDVSAIYVISKRKLDKQKRGHHALVCIGQTDSISGEITKHKNKCIKKHNANVISILPESSEKKRLKIEEDLKAAHSVACGI